MDFLIIGSGAAGLYAALQASKFGDVVILTKSSLSESSSYMAQGGIAAVLHPSDSFESHISDTCEAGRNYCDEEAVNILVREGARCVQELIDDGMKFDSHGGDLSFGLEGGHSNHRVLHSNGAATGKALVEFLVKKVSDSSNIRIIEHAFVFDLPVMNNTCYGAEAYLYKKRKKLSVRSGSTILATGGYSALYNHSTNPHTSTGDGLWLGYNAGAVLRDLEFIQFHPTAFKGPAGDSFLISEAVRGEGARLYNSSGERFMDNFDRKELAPRDTVSQEIFRQLQNVKADHVYLSLQHLDIDEIKARFPGLIGRIEDQGIDLEKEGIPIAPAAHYCIGGIETDFDGSTSVNGLYACGEVAATGVHGANRLASNSLLECLVFARRAAEKGSRKNVFKEYYGPESSFEIDECLAEAFQLLKNKVSTYLSRWIGIQREEEGLEKAKSKINDLRHTYIASRMVNEYYTLRSRGMVNLATLITESAILRKESRGVHARVDFPDRDPTMGRIKFSRNNREFESHARYAY